MVERAARLGGSSAQVGEDANDVGESSDKTSSPSTDEDDFTDGREAGHSRAGGRGTNGAGRRMPVAYSPSGLEGDSDCEAISRSIPSKFSRAICVFGCSAPRLCLKISTARRIKGSASDKRFVP